MEKNCVNQQFADLFSLYASKLSTSNFKPFIDNLNMNDTTINVDHLVEQFKEKLEQNITNHFNVMWKTQEIDQSLNILQKLSIKSKEETGWRPSGKKVTDQTRYCRIQLLEAKIAYLEKEHRDKAEKISNLMIDVEEKRREFDYFTKRRADLTHQMEASVENITEKEKEIQEILRKLSKLSEEVQ